jgi:LysM repeat protein
MKSAENKMKKIVMSSLVVGGLMVVGVGCQSTPAQPLLGPRGVIPKPYASPTTGLPTANQATPSLGGGGAESTIDQTPPVVLPPTPPPVVLPPTPPPVVLPPTPPAAPSEPTFFYTVKAGDSLSGIAYVYGSSIKKITALNGLSNSNIRVGQKLKVPGDGKAKHTITARVPRVDVGSKGGEAAGNGGGAVSAGGKYVVKSGDYPEKIAKSLGVKTSDLLAVNPGLDVTHMKIGQELNVPNGGSAPAGAAPVAGGGTGTGGAPEAMPPPPPMPNTLSHTVLAGEMINDIAAMYGATAQEILELNKNLKSEADIKENMVIRVPSHF